MSTTTAETSLKSSAQQNGKSNYRPGVWARLRHNHLAVFGIIVVGVIGLTAAIAPLLPLADPDTTALSDRLLPPFSAGHILGTDQLGRDMLSRIIWGTRVSLAVGMVATLIAAIAGSIIGILAGYYGRWLDNLLMRGIDMVMAFPYMLLALAIVAVLGPGLMNALFAISIVNIPFFARSVRGVTLGLARREYIDAARLSGLSNGKILTSEVLPNVLPIIIITISTTIGWMILETAGLSFLGLGAQPPQADLGSMLGDGRKLVITAPHVATIPGLVILFLVIGINLFGDGLRDILDPRLKSGALTRPSAATEIEQNLLRKTKTEQSGVENVLTVKDLKTHFLISKDIYKAVDGLDFILRKGECLGIVGESGCGKSVSAMSLLRLVPTPPGRIIDGQIIYQGEDIIRVPLNQLRETRGGKIAYIFQDPLTTLNPLFSVGEQIAEAIQAHQGLSRKTAQQRAIELMHRVQIPNAKSRASAYPHEFSGGMRQRIGIAMALANDPDIIIADEPTTALDVTVQAEVLKLLDTLRKEKGVSVIFITHDFGVVSEICDRVMVMYAGRVVESGTTAQIFDQPLHPYTRMLMSCVPRLGQAERTIEAIPGLPPAVNALPHGCAFADRCDKVTNACRNDEIELSQFNEGRAARCIHVNGVNPNVA
jgi:peptide/nickel transport system permease protein